MASKKVDPRQVSLVDRDAAPLSALLQAQARKLENCRGCSRFGIRAKPLCGGGDSDAKIVVVTHSPTGDEDLRGTAFPEDLPMVKMIRSAVTLPAFFTYAVSCSGSLKGLDLDTDENEGLAECRKHLVQRLEWLRPKGMILVGKHVALGLIPALKSVPWSEARFRVYGYQDRIPALIWEMYQPHWTRHDIGAARGALVNFSGNVARASGS